LIIPLLHRQPEALDMQRHRHHKIAFPVADWSVASRLNSVFVAATEFADACREYPVVFVRAGKAEDGRDEVAPFAVLGVMKDQNLYLDGPARTNWRAFYRPVMIQSYPFCIGRVDAEHFAVCVDMAWSGVGTEQGQALFTEAGEPTEFLSSMRNHMELVEREIQNTRVLGRRLLELDLLRDMRFDATLPDGRKHVVDGFLTVDKEKAQTLPDAVLGELHRNGILGLIHLHWASLGLMRRLIDWYAFRLKEPAPSAPAAPVSPPPPAPPTAAG
jgi:hypothetical protein